MFSGIASFFNRLTGKGSDASTLAQIVDDAATAKPQPTTEDAEIANFDAEVNAMDDERHGR